MSRVIDWYMYMSNLRGGGVGWSSGGVLFGGRGLQFFSGQLPRILNIPSESSAQAQSIATLFKQIGYKWGSVDMSKSQRHTRSGAGRGVSQANGAAIHPKLPGLCQHEIVSGIMRK